MNVADADRETVIEARGIEKSFDGEAVLRGIDLDIRTDETTLLMGPNGSGKTILLSCLAGGLHPTGGEATVLGDSPAEARAKLSFMLQGGLALFGLTGQENIDFYTDLHPRTTDGWREITDRLELTDELDKRVRDYSGGMTRKLELAIALSVDVPLYLLDEPVAELDLTTIDRFHALIREKRDAGATVVISSHTPSDMEVADRIVFVRDGRVVAEGDPDELFDALAPVIRLAGRTNTESIRKQLLAGRFFEGDATRRGFLADAVSPRSVEGSNEGVEIVEPTWTDLFNYYVHVVPSLEKSQETGPDAAPSRPASGRN